MAGVTWLAPSLRNKQGAEAPLIEFIPTPNDLSLWRLSVDQYHALAAAGILQDGDPVELLEGLLAHKITKEPPHTLATQQMRSALERILPAIWFVNDQEPVTIDDSEPEPDVVVIQGVRRDYLERHPGPQEIALVVEVADATLSRDRGTKKRVYARAGIPVYWIVNLIENCVEVYTEPTGPAVRPDYRQRQQYSREQAVPVVIQAQVIGQIAVQELLP